MKSSNDILHQKRQKNEPNVLITAQAAAEQLGVHVDSVMLWIKNGRFPEVLRRQGGKVKAFVPLAALDHAFEVQCRWCGKTFRAKHPAKARYCCVMHRDRHMYALRRNEQLRNDA